MTKSPPGAPVEALEPCPFCGNSKPVLDSTFWGMVPEVRCPCGAKIWGRDHGEVTRHWNTRALSSKAAPLADEPPGTSFDDWITDLEEKVIEGEYGYEPGEFTVYPDHWRPLYDEGLTPKQAFERALKARREGRAEEAPTPLADVGVGELVELRGARPKWATDADVLLAAANGRDGYDFETNGMVDVDLARDAINRVLTALSPPPVAEGDRGVVEQWAERLWIASGGRLHLGRAATQGEELPEGQVSWQEWNEYAAKYPHALSSVAEHYRELARNLATLSQGGRTRDER